MKKCIVLLLAILCLTSRARAFTITIPFTGAAPAWPAMPVQYWINQAGSPSVTNGSDFAAVQAAFQTWQNDSLAAVSFQYMGTTPVTGVGEDGINLVTFVDSSVPIGSDVVATTFTFMTFDAAGLLDIQESDIAVNPAAAVSTSGDLSKYDIQGILTHEVGHFLGIDHSGLMSAVMAPVGSPPMIDERTLTYDDMAAAAWLYPISADFSSLGAISGTITAGPTAVFGVHIVALDANSTPLVSTLSNPDGTYELDFLPPGSYRIYAEPLDGPLYVTDIGGNPSSFYNNVGTGFSTTYFGNTSNLSLSPPIAVSAGFLSNGTNISLLAPTTLNITEPRGSAARIGLGGQTTLTAGGAGLTTGDTFSTPAAGVTLSGPTYGGSIASDAPTSAQIGVTASSTAVLGPKNISVTRSTATSVLTGAFVVVNPQPAGIQLAPASGPADGGTSVTVTGQNFRLGANIYFGGLPATSVQWISASTIFATTPPNVPGGSNVLVVNSDGTWGAQTGAFTYSQQTPQISSVSPSSGPPTTTVQILGTEFDSHIQNLTVSFNGTSATIVSATRTLITAIVPYGAATGLVTVNVFGETATGPIFTVTAPSTSTNVAPAARPFADVSPANGGSALSFDNNDDASAIVQLPFTFSFFNKTYPAGSPIAVCTNGWISLDAVSTPEYQNGSLPGTSVQRPDGSTGSIPPALIAPFFQDLFIQPQGGISFQTLGVSPNRQFVMEWLDMGIHDQQFNSVGAAITFEAILYEGTNDLQFVYQSLSGPMSDGSGATVGIQDSTRTKAVLSGFDQSILTNGLAIPYYFNNAAYVNTPGLTVEPYSIPDRGGMSSITSGGGSVLTVGYAAIQPNAGNTTPGGVAIFGFTQNGILVTEAGVPASPLLLGGRLYAQVGGTIDTGVAIANPNNQPAAISFFFTDSTGSNFGSGTGTIPPNGQISQFLDQSTPMPFNSGNVQGTFTFTSNVPVGVIALRQRLNERGEVLYTTLPVLDTSAPASTSTQILSRFADGLGWTTQVILVNPGNSIISGTINFYGGLDQPLLDGKPLTLTAGAGGQSLSTFPYSIPAQSSFSLQTAGLGAIIQTGSVQVVPASGNAAPSSLSIFSYKPAGVTITEAGVASVAGTAFRMYVEASGTPYTLGSIQTGLAIANSSSSEATVTLDLTGLNGAELGLTTSLTIPPNGEIGEFLSQLYANQTLPLPLKGILRITSSGPGLSVVGLRGRYNQRNEFLITTTPASNEATTATSAEMVFPQVADGGGWSTQFIVVSGTTNQAVSGNLAFVNQNGTPLSLNFQ